jgi:hypothetical protein
MGGFVSRNGHHPITTSKQLEDVAEYLADICAIEADDIKERSKGDALSKGVALIQGLWFTTQCLARVHQDLPVTELEVATLAFTTVNIPVWLLWWDKPLDVQRPIQIGPKEDREMANNEPVDNQGASVVPPGETGVNGDAKRWQTGFLGGIAGFLNGYYPNYHPRSYISVPSFWSTNDGNDKTPYSFLIECLVGTIFGVIHCIAWNADFSSTGEMWMWRSCSVLVAVLPVILGLVTIAVTGGMLDLHSAMGTIGAFFSAFNIPAYIIARLFLIILPLIALRALPPGAITDVNWSIYIPHV